MEVAVPVPPLDFNFDSACSSPYMTAPSSPQRFGNFFFSSAPTSPSHAASFYYDFNQFGAAHGDGDGRISSASEIPFLWEELPGIAKSGCDGCSSVADEDFEFDFSGQLERTSLSAEELFDCGKIRALKPPPSYGVTDSVSSNATSPRSPRWSKIAQGKGMVQEAVSARQHHRRDNDLFEEAFKAATRRTGGSTGTDAERNRGRERTTDTAASRSSSSIRRSGSRSLSPLRVSDIVFDSDLELPAKSVVSSATSNGQKQSVSSSASFLSSFSFSRGQRRWRIRDLLLFRSASEGRATDKKAVEEMKNSSFRSIESLSSASSSRRRGPISPHELHYKTNRAVSEELRKKTSLPYKHGLLGCLGFNSSMQRSFSRGLGSITRA